MNRIQRKSLEAGRSYIFSLDSPACVCGHGGHVSVEEHAHGRGQGPAELFFATEPAAEGQNLVFHLYESHLPGEDRLQHHRVDLGPKLDLGWVKVLLTPTGIEVCWARGALITSDKKEQYLRASSIPFSTCSAFSKAFGGQVYWVENGLLCTDPERGGSDYRVGVESVSLNGASGGGTSTDTNPIGNTGPTGGYHDSDFGSTLSAPSGGDTGTDTKPSGNTGPTDGSYPESAGASP